MLLGRVDQGMAEIFERESDPELRMRLEGYGEWMEILRQNQRCTLHLPEIGIKWPIETSGNHHVDRLRRKVLIEVVGRLRDAVADALGDQGEVNPPETVKPSPKATSEPASSSEDHDIMAVAELMIAAKKRIAKTDATIRADIRLLKEWTGRSKVTEYTKKDLIDFICNCLPFIPANITKRKEYKGKSLRECVKLSKQDQEKYPPISHVTCGNRLVNIVMVFNYARDQLGIITVNPAKGIEIPKVRVVGDRTVGAAMDSLAGVCRMDHKKREKQGVMKREWFHALLFRVRWQRMPG